MSRPLKAEGHRFIGEQVSWAGDCPWTDGLCLGTESGNLYLPAPGADHQGEGITPVKITSDAVNGVAFVGQHIAVTSRNEVEIGYLIDVAEPQIERCPHTFRGGSHGVVSSTQGLFLAPIGVDGVLLMTPDNNRGVEALIARQSDRSLNFYRLVRLGSGPDGEVFACAARGDGLLAFSIDGGLPSGPLVGHHFGGSDIVDVCPLGDSRCPLAAACVSRNRDIFFVRNVLEERAPFALGYRELDGAAYSLRSAQGHIFLLTDSYFVTLPELGRKFLAGESLDANVAVSLIRTDAADAFLWADRSILLPEYEVVTEVAVEDLVSNLLGAGHASSIPRELRFSNITLHHKFVEPAWSGLRSRLKVDRPAA